MGKSGKAPSIGAGQGFFPTSPQLNRQAFKPWDMAPMGQQMGLPSFNDYGGGVFGPPQQPQQQQQGQSIWDEMLANRSGIYGPSGPWYGGQSGHGGR